MSLFVVAKNKIALVVRDDLANDRHAMYLLGIGRNSTPFSLRQALYDVLLLQDDTAICLSHDELFLRILMIVFLDRNDSRGNTLEQRRRLPRFRSRF